MNRIAKLLAGLLLTATIASPAYPQARQTATPAAPLPANNAMYRSVVETDLVNLLRAEGMTIDPRPDLAQPIAAGTNANGIKLYLIGTACGKDNTDCNGIEMQIGYPVNSRVTDATINQANLKYASLKTFKSSDGRMVYVARYVILDNGVTWYNIRRNIQVLVNLAPRAWAVAAPQ